MTDEKFVHNDPDAFHGKEISLHDCVAEKISLEDGILRFNLPDGFWVTVHHEVNECANAVRTGASVVDFAVKDMEEVELRIFNRRKFLWKRKTSVESWNIDQLISAVNSGKCTIGFITQYRSYYEQLWHCDLRSKKKPYYRECLLQLPQAEAVFRWNNLRPECEW